MARQFDIVRLANGSLVVVLQDDLHEALATQVVAPLVPLTEARSQPRGLAPTIDMGERPMAVLIASMAAIPAGELRATMGNARHLRDEIVRALDILFTGV